jgi:uncharacterized tellurite resistance protein B-like protein
MFDHLLDFLHGTPTETAPDRPRLAVAALLLEAARLDEQFTEDERTLISRLLSERFQLGPWEIGRLMDAATTAADGSTDLYHFTREIVDNFGPEERIGIIEMLWEVAYAHGELAPEEDMLIRRVAGLIHVEDQARGMARLRVLDRQRLPTR